MAEGNVQLKLRVSLDTVYLKEQLASLGALAKREPLNIVPTIDPRNLKFLAKSIGKKITVSVNDSQVVALTERLKTAKDQLAEFSAANSKVVIGVTAKAAVTQKDARKVRSDVYRSIMENGGKILLPVGLQPISQTAVNAFKADLQKKLGSINVKVQPSAGGAAPSATPSRSPGFQSARESISNLNVEQLRKRAFSSLGSESRSAQQVANWLDTIVQQGLKGSAKAKQLNAIRDFLAESLAQAAGRGVEARMASGGGGQGPLGKSLDTFARGLFRMLGMDPAQVRAERQARLMPPAINWQAQVPQRNIPIGPSATGRALTGAAPLTPIAGAPAPFGLLPSITRRTANAQGVNAIMQGLGGGADDGGAGKLALTFDATRKRIDAILAEYFKVVEAQVRQEFGGAELRQGLRVFAYVAQALRDAEQRTKQARIDDAVASFLRSLENVIRMSEARLRIYSAQVTDLGASQRMLPGRREQLALPPSTGRAPQPYSSVRAEPSWQERAAARAAQAYARSASRGADFAPPMGNLPPFGGSGGGRDRVTGSGEPPQPRGGALVPYAQRTDLPSGYIAGAQMARALGNADQYLRQSRVPLAGAIAELSGEFTQATKQVLLYGTAYKALAFFMDLPNQALNAATALQTFRNQLNAVTGSADNANRSFSFVDGLAERFAVPLASVRQGFVRMYASMEPAGFGANEIEGLFSGISKAAATFGMSREQVDRVTYAFSQMASKGQIMAEELRGQLGDVLPGSLALFAKAAQMELPEFTKAMENGRFSGEAMRVVLNNVAILMNQQFAKGAEGAAKTLQGALNQMQNGLQRLYEAFEPLVNEVAQQVFPLISGAIGDATKAVQAFTAATQGNTGPSARLAGNAQKIYQVFQQVVEIARAVQSTLASIGPLLQALGEFALLATTQLARFVNTPVGGFLASFALKLALATAALQLLARTGILAVVAAMVRMITAMRGGATAMIALGNGARAAGISLATLRTGLVALGSTAVLAGIMLLVERFMMLRGAVDGVRQSTQSMLGSISSMAQGGAVRELRNMGADLQKQISTFEQLKPFVSGGAIGPAQQLTPEAAQKMKDVGLGGFLGTSVLGKPVVTDWLNASKVINERLAGLRKQAESVSQKLPEAMQVATSVAATANQALAPIPPSAGDAEAAAKVAAKKEKEQQEALERAQRETDNYARQQAQLITATADHQSKLREIGFDKDQDLAEQRYEQLKGLIDAEYDYRLTRANEVQAVQLNLEKKLSEARLSSLRSIEMTELRLREARLKVENAQAKRAAAAQAAAIMPEAPETALPPGAPAAPNLPMPGNVYERALLDTIAFAEGTLDRPDSGYRTMFTGRQFSDLSRHPRIINRGGGHASDAAGRYQFLSNTWSGLRLPDFSPRSQDAGALALARRRGMNPSMPLTRQGIDKLAPEWASFPTLRTGTSYYGQGGKSFSEIERFYAKRVAAYSKGQLPPTTAGMPVSGPAFSMQRREQDIEFGVEEAQAEEKALKQVELARLQNDLLKDLRTTAIEVSDAIGQVLPLEQLTLENQLLGERNALMLQGAPEEFIQATEKLTIAKAKSASLEAALNSQIAKTEEDQVKLKKQLDDGTISQDSYNIGITNSNASLKEYNVGLKEIPGRLQAVTLETLNSAVAQIKNADALKAMQEAVGMVKSAVEGVMGSYKNFVGEVLKGGSLKDAAKRLQEALRDQAVTMFLDFAMKPMQKFLEDSLLKVFGLESEEQQRQKSLAKLQEQINLLSQIRDNTAQGGTGTNPGTAAVGGIGASDFIPLTGGLGRAAVDAPFGVDVRSIVEAEEGIRATSESMYQLGATMPALGQGVGQLTQNFAASAIQSGAAAKTWQQSLGATVQSIGMAAGAVMSIAGGVSQMKEGGISGVLGGIGSIFMGVGGALGGFGGAGGLGGLFGGGSNFASKIPFDFVHAPNIFGQLAVPGFANGGVVNGPTLGLVGEGKYNEAIVPLPDGRSIPVKMAGGQSAREAMSNGGMPSYAPSTVSFSFESTKINGVEYVSRDQLELAMASTRREAIKEGAKRGMGMTLDKIQQSPGTRRSIAMGRR